MRARGPKLLVGLLLAAILVIGCNVAQRAPDRLPAQHTIVRDQLVIYSDFRLPARHRLLEQLCALRGDLSELLQMPTSDEPIHVFVFDSAERFNAYLRIHHPNLPPRRAFFLESDTRLAVYVHWGDRVAEDLRHEVAHGYLHAVVPQIPLWLDEGLAEYFEVARGGHGLNRPHVDELMRLRAEGVWRPNLARLGALKTIEQMAQVDYAESWAWVHFLLHTTPERRRLLLDHLRILREEGTAPPLWLIVREKIPHPHDALLRHLDSLATSR